MAPIKEKQPKPMKAEREPGADLEEDIGKISGIQMSISAKETATIDDINGQELLDDVIDRIEAYEQLLECLNG